MTDTEASRIAAGLTDFARMGLKSSHASERLMGGFFGLAWTDPTLVEAVGINHPIFGSHYRLTPLGLRVRAILTQEEASS